MRRAYGIADNQRMKGFDEFIAYVQKHNTTASYVLLIREKGRRDTAARNRNNMLNKHL